MKDLGEKDVVGGTKVVQCTLTAALVLHANRDDHILLGWIGWMSCCGFPFPRSKVILSSPLEDGPNIF